MNMRLFFILVALSLAWPVMRAQHTEGVPHLEELLTAGMPDATETVVSGKDEKTLTKMGLDYFKSISVNTPASMQRVNNLARLIESSAVDQESSVSRGVINYAFYQFAPAGKQNRYLFLFSDGKKTVAMYMEGKATFGEIKNMIKKRK